MFFGQKTVVNPSPAECLGKGKPYTRRWMMTARITSRQIRQFAKLVGEALTAVRGTLTKEGVQNILRRPKEFARRFVAFIITMAAEYYILLSDDEAIAWIVKHAKKSTEEARQIVEGFRKKARAQGVADTVKLHAEVLPGCLFKRDIPRMGPCWESFRYLQSWNFPDPPTEHCLVSWVSVLLVGSTKMNVPEQVQVVAAFKAEAALPVWYEVSFGSVNHVGGMALSHFSATGVDPFSGMVVRTDTCGAVGDRLVLGWFGGRLICGSWGWGDGLRGGDLAVFACGVVKALGR